MMSEREARLRNGYVERAVLSADGDYAIAHFYWEPFYDEQAERYAQAFTIDYGGLRVRETDFNRAVEWFDNYERRAARVAALKALGIEDYKPEDNDEAD